MHIYISVFFMDLTEINFFYKNRHKKVDLQNTQVQFSSFRFHISHYVIIWITVYSIYYSIIIAYNIITVHHK